MIAITSTGDKLSSLMDLRFGRSNYFCFLEGQSYEFVENPFLELEHDAAIRVTEWLAQKGVKKVITGEIGAKAKKALTDNNIQGILLDVERATIQKVMDRVLAV